MDPALKDQVIGVLRILVPAILTLLASRGWVTPEAVGGLGQAIIDGVVGVIILAAAIWSWWGHRQVNQIANVANLPDVKAVVTTKQIANVELKDEPKVVARVDK